MKKHAVISLWALTLFIPVISQGQSINRLSSELREAEWQPAIIKNGSNEIDGVSFFSHSSICGPENASYIKLVNSNSYAAVVSYQPDPASPARVHIRMAPHETLEGSCGVTNEKLAKLVFKFSPKKNEDEKRKYIDFLKSSVAVSQITN